MSDRPPLTVSVWWSRRINRVWLASLIVGSSGLIVLNHTHRERWWSLGYSLTYGPTIVVIPLYELVRRHRATRGPHPPRNDP